MNYLAIRKMNPYRQSFKEIHVPVMVFMFIESSKFVKLRLG